MTLLNTGDMQWPPLRVVPEDVTDGRGGLPSSSTSPLLPNIGRPSRSCRTPTVGTTADAFNERLSDVQRAVLRSRVRRVRSYSGHVDACALTYRTTCAVLALRRSLASTGLTGAPRSTIGGESDSRQ